MSLFHGKKLSEEENTDDFATMLLPFLNEDSDNSKSDEKPVADKPKSEAFKAVPQSRESSAKKATSPETILTNIGSIDPLQALKNTVKQTVEEGKTEEANSSEPTQDSKAKAVDEKNLQKTAAAANPPTVIKGAERRKKRTSSLLAKCMPYIYDLHPYNYAEEKPDYTLESVVDIIESAEKREDEKIARMYNLKTADIQRIGADGAEAQPPEVPEEKPKLRVQETSIKKPLKIGDVSRSSAKMFDTVSIPKVSTTLFDDFSGRRTDVSGEENITTPYSAQGGMDSAEEGHTRIIPDLKPETEVNELYEDILSHTRPVNVVDISSSSGKKAPVKVSGISEEEPEIDVDEFKGEQDITRVGSMLKRDVFASRLRFMITLFLTAVATAIHIPTIKADIDPMVLGVVALFTFGFAVIVNLNIFLGFKGAFTRQSKIELPLALATSLMVVYFVYSIIMGSYPYEPIILPLISLLAYNWCVYRKATAIFGNFKLVASRRSKKAVALIDDATVTSAMARSIISGEILAAGEQETDEIDDFLKNTLSDSPFSGKLNVFAAVALVASAFIGLAVGVSFASFSSGILAAATVLCLGAAPSMFIADMLPFAGLSDRLYRERAAVCSKYSAEKIEQINAAVISSSELFPKGCIKLYNMTPLSANPLDETIVLAAAVADVAGSPLFPMFKKILTDDTLLPEADSVKYEESLGISGWVGNNHIMIGNRSLMQAHGVRVPELEVDRKILHKGFFPVYIACDQRACALLVVGYSVDREIGTEIGRLNDRGVTLLVKNCDPNITEQMLCDYYSLYPDLVKILDHNGVDKYQGVTEQSHSVSAHGFHRGDIKSFLSILTGSMKLRVLSNVLCIIHILASVVIWLLFAGMSLGGTMTLMGAGICALCEVVSIVVCLTAYFVGK